MKKERVILAPFVGTIFKNSSKRFSASEGIIRMSRGLDRSF